MKFGCFLREMKILRKYKRFIAVLLPFLLSALCLLHSKTTVVKANTLNYNNTIYVALTMHNNNSDDLYSFDFCLTGNYLYSDGNNKLGLNSNTNYNMSIKNGSITLASNGTSIASTGKSITIEPVSDDSVIQFRKIPDLKSDILRSFKGSIIISPKSDASIRVINKLNLEDYVKGVVPYEMSNSYPVEALKAQAVAARTYALYQMIHGNNYNNYGYNVDDTTSYQVYYGYNGSYLNSNNAVDATKGQVLTYNGSVIQAFFASSNGGATEKSSNVWYSDLPYLKINNDIYDNYSWTKAIASADLRQMVANYENMRVEAIVLASIDINSIQTFIQADSSNPSNRIKYIKVSYSDIYGSSNDIVLGKEAARTFFNVPSALYTVLYKDGQYIFNGKGFGHGLGLSQQAAKNRALGIVAPNTTATVKPQNYSEILNFYYCNTEISKISQQIAEFENSVGGKDRYETAIRIADDSYSGSFNNVILATGDGFADALSAAPLAKELNAPILFVNKLPSYTQSQNTIKYILSKLNKNGNIYLLGGQGVISNEFEKLFASDAYKSYGYNVKRLDGHLYGTDRYATNADVIKNLNVQKNTPVIIASGKNFPDGISASSLAAQKKWPVFLVGDTLSSAAEQNLKNISPSNVYIIGGTGAVSEDIKSKIKKDLGFGDDKVVRICGNNRYETNLALNNYFMKNSDIVLITSGRNFPDALAGSVNAYKNAAPIILVNDGDYSCAQIYLQNNYDNGILTKIKPLGKIFDNDTSLKNILSYSNQ